jgi:hypothetical protein
MVDYEEHLFEKRYGVNRSTFLKEREERETYNTINSIIKNSGLSY